jgi:hypothetical protein
MLFTRPAGFPVSTATRGFDVAISHLGERAFINFQSSANIGVTGSLEGTATDNDVKSITRRCSTGNTTGCPCPAGTCNCELHKIAYTPYRNKAIAAVWYNNTSNSKVMVLDAETLSLGYGGTIQPAHYYCVANPLPTVYFNQPEGVAMQPLYDRDRDGISDLVEANNYGTNTLNLRSTIPDNPLSLATGSTTNGNIIGSVKLPEEGIGYRHFYGSDGLNMDNWGTLKLIKIIEQVGREWNQLHPTGPRISIGDLSLQGGGRFYPPPLLHEHDWHQQGVDVDVRYVKNDGGEGPCNINPHPTLDPPDTPQCNFNYINTKKLLDLFCKAGAKEILVDSTSALQNDTYIPGCQVQFDDPAHRHHFHVRIIY